MRWLDGITDATDVNLGKHREMVRDREAWCLHPWGRKELDMIRQLNNNNNFISHELLLIFALFHMIQEDFLRCDSKNYLFHYSPYISGGPIPS